MQGVNGAFDVGEVGIPADVVMGSGVALGLRLNRVGNIRGDLVLRNMLLV